MFRNWSVSNFKSFYNRTDVGLAPLTIIAGENGSGKSAFLQTMLLCAQTLADRHKEKCLVLDGKYVSLEAFADAAPRGRDGRVRIQCVCRPRTEMDAEADSRGRRKRAESGIEGIRLDLSLHGDPRSGKNHFHAYLGWTCESDCGEENSMYFGGQEGGGLALSEYKRCYPEDESLFISEDLDFNPSILFEDKSYSLFDEDLHAERFIYRIYCALNHFLPEKIVYCISAADEEAAAIYHLVKNFEFTSKCRHRDSKRKIEVSKAICFVLPDTISNAVLDGNDYANPQNGRRDLGTISLGEIESRLKVLDAKARQDIANSLRDRDLFEKLRQSLLRDDPKKKREVLVSAEFPPALAEAVRCLKKSFDSSFSYVGALRDEIRPADEKPVRRWNSVGTRGGNTARVLAAHQSDNVSFIPADSFRERGMRENIAFRTLGAAVSDWLGYLGFEGFAGTSFGDAGADMTMNFATSEGMRLLQRQGTGMHQVLPILVSCLLAPHDGTLVFEHPEQHLSPRMQARLGDFFLSMALCGRQCIVETHSEYLINQLRRRIAAAPDASRLLDAARLYLVRKKEGGPDISEVKINEYGAIPDWPRGFMDESERQAADILGEALAKRAARRRDGYDTRS